MKSLSRGVLIKVFGIFEFWTPYSKHLTTSELVKKFPTFCRASLFITAFSKTGRWTRSWFRLYTFSLKLLLILSPFYDSFPQVVPTFQLFLIASMNATFRAYHASFYISRKWNILLQISNYASPVTHQKSIGRQEVYKTSFFILEM